jgi:hypothetical protein
MQNTNIIDATGHLGPHDPLLKVGQDQCMNWADQEYCLCRSTHGTESPCLNCVGPFHFSAAEIEKRKVDRPTGQTKERDKTRAELVKEITDNGTILQRKHTLVDLQDIARRNGIGTKKTVAKVTTGWVGQPKGLLQVARERGFVDIANYRLYTKNGKKKQDGTMDEERSLVQIIGNWCDDFRNEKAHLQVLADHAIGILVDFTPKFHAEMAGEGVEYSWAYSKSCYRRSPLQKKKSRASFRDLV